MAHNKQSGYGSCCLWQPLQFLDNSSPILLTGSTNSSYLRITAQDSNYSSSSTCGTTAQCIWNATLFTGLAGTDQVFSFNAMERHIFGIYLYGIKSLS